MNLKVIIPKGQTEITVNGLTQWDYGRKLEIHADDLPAIIEVHFACAGMDAAVVRSCSVVDGIAEATIPDRCLEQTSPVFAWVFAIDGTEGATVKTITMPVVERTQPQPSATIPTEVADRYTELIGAVNEQVESLKDGTVVVKQAQNADSAGTAGHADTSELIRAGWVTLLDDNSLSVNTGTLDVELARDGVYLFTLEEDDLFGFNAVFVLHVHGSFDPSVSTAVIAPGVSGDIDQPLYYFLEYESNGGTLRLRTKTLEWAYGDQVDLSSVTLKYQRIV